MFPEQEVHKLNVKIDTFNRNDPTLKRIFSLMEEHGENRTQLGKSIGLTRAAISSWAIGRCESYKHEKYLNKIANHYNVSVGYLIGEDSASENEISDLLAQFKSRSEIRNLFYATKDATKKDIECVIKILETLKDQNRKEENSIG